MNKIIKIIKEQKLIIVSIFIVISILSLLFFSMKKTVQAEEPKILEQTSNETPQPIHLKVDVKGSVLTPGVYELNEGDRVIEAITAAGGTLEDSNLRYLNLSKRLTDQMTIYVYTNEEIKNYEASKVKIEYVEVPIPCNCPDNKNDACAFPSDTETNSLVSLNKASVEQLMTLSGIGDAKAKDIINYREQKPFETIEELKNVKGIGDSIFEKIKDKITI